MKVAATKAAGTKAAAPKTAAAATRKAQVTAGPAATTARARAPRKKVAPPVLERLVATAVASLEDDKAENVVVLDIATRSSFADRMIVATGLADRQIQVAPDVVDWLALRMERDLGLARHLVAAIDRKSLADRRPVTRRLAAELLDKLAPSEPSSAPSSHEAP